MRVTIDLNVVIDALLHRPGSVASIEILSRCASRKLTGFIPSHGIPTIYYILRSKLSKIAALEGIDNILEILSVFPVDYDMTLAARGLGIEDFEDALVAVSATKSNSQFIITGNMRDFVGSAVPAISPERFLELIAE